MKIAVLGAGAFGTALAINLAQSGKNVVLWGRDSTKLAIMSKERANRAKLPDAEFPENLSLEPILQKACDADVLLLAVPMQRLASFANENAALLREKHLVACCKGIDLNSNQGPVRVLETNCPEAKIALLTGPSFAHDIAVNLPTALTLAGQSDDIAKTLQSELSTPSLRLYSSSDTIGAELGGALKNVMAIAAGAAMGAGLGDSARAALITRGYAEMVRLCLHHGGRAETLAGLSGFGDLVLTCTSEGSRNYRYGFAIGAGDDFDPSITVEGKSTAIAAANLAQEEGIDLPITRVVALLCENKITLPDAMQMLLSRPLKEE
jgi:glycerol-3-phosphate dehydrogenase (NAD(P)+)